MYAQTPDLAAVAAAMPRMPDASAGHPDAQTLPPWPAAFVLPAELTVLTAAAAQAGLAAHLATVPDPVVDLTAIRDIDLAGLALVLSLSGRVPSGQAQPRLIWTGTGPLHDILTRAGADLPAWDLPLASN